jgi:hypothetical protein
MKQKTYSIFILCFLVLFNFSFAQEYIIQDGKNTNRIDANGNRQGKWNIIDKKINLEFKTSFKDDVMSDTILFFQNKKLEFIWINLKNDSVKYLCNVNEKFCEGYFTKENIEYCMDDSLVIKKINFFLDYSFFTEYPGGDEKFSEKIGKNIYNYVFNLESMFIIGEVYFVVNEKGLVEQVKVVKTNLPQKNDKLILAIEKLGRWLPGFDNGKFKKTQFIIPVKFNR